MLNFLSDTVTLPTKEMMEAIQQAVLGDDVYGQDQTVNELESLAARMLGMEAACLMPSGTMANLSSIMAHCPRGSKVLVGDESDIYIYEAGGASVCGGIVYEPIPTQADGRLLVQDLEKAFPVDEEDPQFALPALLCLENTHNRCGGKVLPIPYLQEVKEFASARKIPVHMDGARIFNASVALDMDVREITCYADSIQVCLSKGLSAPVGSIVAGSHDHLKKVRRIRKMLGGGMRQAGIIAAPGLVALHSMVKRLDEDHQHAKQLAHGLAEIDGIDLDASEVQTNIVLFRITDPRFSWSTFLETAKEYGVIFSEMGYGRIRAVVHRQISSDDINKAVQAVEKMLKDSPL
ncbi:low-specificity L-threonine aldolase [Brevibacillus ruminantium]|uniref:Low-specificity L-threonine aldolase n=1 Tax=Brevibacillus ruminantium TaxID=2950604 RepID=A0ABY4WKK1_9BACL|nr:low-specificity L-threonine aldolase [Brevibacillus ruminantium]USG66587.1 low-specificity L-threonine aldolase [Brevibacillus ruminantium]